MGDYTDLATVRAMEGMDSLTVFPDADITVAIDFAEDAVIDQYTGTSWVAKAFSVTLDGTGTGRIVVEDLDARRVLFIRSISSCTVDGSAQSDIGDWSFYPEGIVLRKEGTFTATHPGRNIVLAGTAGATTTAPEDIQYAARTIARQFLLDAVSRVEDRALSIQNDYGTVRLAQPGMKYPTGLPAVDVILNRRRHRAPSVA